MSRLRLVVALALYTAVLNVLAILRADLLTAALLVTRLLVIAALVLFLRDRSKPSLPVQALFVAFVCAGLAVSSWIALAPGTADEYAYRFQASAISHGKLAAEAPPGVAGTNRENRTPFFFIHHVIHGGKWFGKYPPGWPVLLAPAMWLGIERFWNIFFALVIVWCTWRLALLWFGKVTAEIAVVLLLLCPMFLYNSAGWFSHPSCGAFIAIGMYSIAKGTSDQRARLIVLGFGAIAASIVIRPLTGACAAGVMLLFLLRTRAPRQTIATAVVLIAAAGGLLALYNYAMTGDPLRTTYALYTGTTHTQEATFTIDNLTANLKFLTTHSILTTETTIAPFMLLAALAAFFVAPRQERTRIAVLSGLFGVLVIGYLSQVESSFSAVGERYYYEGLFAIAMAAARTWTILSERLSLGLTHVLAVAALLQAVPMWHYAREVQNALIPFAKMTEHVRSAHMDNGVIFVQWTPDFESRDFNPNPVDWQKAPVFVMNAPSSPLFGELTCSMRRRRWRLVRWDAVSASVQTLATGPGCQE